MGLLANPEHKVVRVYVRGGSVRFTLDKMTSKDWIEYRNKRFSMRARGRKKLDQSDKSSELKIKLFDRKVLSAEAFDEEDQPTPFEYIDPETKEVRELTPQVPNWTDYIDASWKVSAMSWLDEEEAEEEDAVKN